MSEISKAFSGWTEGPLGRLMADAMCKAVDEILKTNSFAKEHGYKELHVLKAASDFVDGERADISVITNSKADRDKEVVIAKGIDLAMFRKNPVVFFNHRRDLLPVGKCLWVKPEGANLKAKTRYSARPEEWENEWMPDAVWSMVRSGDLPGKSIGFLPIEGRAVRDDEKRKNPDWDGANWVYTKALMLEYSVVGIPANAEALVQSVAKGVVTSDILDVLGIDFDPTLKIEDKKIEDKKAPEPDPPEPEPTIEKVEQPHVTTISKSDLEKAIQTGLEKNLAMFDMGGIIRDAVDKALGRV